MYVYQVTTECASCNHKNILIMTDKKRSAKCENCEGDLINFRRFDGVVYVLSNPRVEGVKIGMTKGDVFQRAKQVSGTGVPGRFEVIAAYPSKNPRADEKRVHDKLKRYRIAKEHFGLDEVTAVTKIKSTLKREWVYLKPSFVSAVEDRILSQKAAIKANLSGTGSSEPSNVQTELFDRHADHKHEAEPDQSKKPGGFLANLFN